MEMDKGLQGMRGWAAIMVLYYHILAYLPFSITLLLPLYSGYSGVYFFFLISGYILMRKFDSGDYDLDKKFNGVKYYLRRIFRIWPLYFIAIPIFALTLGMPIIWQDFLFIQNYFPSTFSWTPPWTLVIEELFYLILPIWAIAFRKNWLYSVLGMFGVSFGYLLFLMLKFHTFTVSYYYAQFPMFAFCYALGTIAARGKVLKIDKGVLLITFVCVSCLFVYVENTIGVMVFSFMYFLILCNMKESRFFCNKISGFLGSLTYPIYVLGLPVEYVLTAKLGILNLMWIPLTIIITIGGAYILHKAFEKPFIGLGRKIENYVLKLGR